MTMLSRTRRGLAALALLLAMAATPSLARARDGDMAEIFHQTNLVSDVAGAALLQDPDLVNAWGVSFPPTGPFWVSDAGTGKSTLYSVTYDSSGKVTVAKLGLVVTIPGPAPTVHGLPSGQVFNGTTAFHGDRFIFAGLDGSISGWRGSLGTKAEFLVPPRRGSSNTGIELVMGSSGPMLLAANFGRGTLDVYDGNINLVASLMDPDAPVGFAPFNVHEAGGRIYVNYAMVDPTTHRDAPGPGHGLIDIFDLATGTFTRFATGTAAGGHNRKLNSPWGVALVPAGFGRFGGDVLIGNFGDGAINVFRPKDGHFRGQLMDGEDHVLRIDGLWSITPGNDGAAGKKSLIYFAAGPAKETHGLLGSLEPVLEEDDD